jgi:putative thioredoxin
MGQSIVVSSLTFDEAVLQHSYNQPVLVDFYATWCGPCQLLKPMLEKLAQEYDFTLAKVDIDQNPDLAHTYGVEGVPDVRMVNQGQMMEGFVGALPEPQLRELLAKLGLKSALEQDLATLKAAQATADFAQVKIVLTQLLTRYPENPQVLIVAAQVYLQQGDGPLALQYLDLIPAQERQYTDQVEGLRGLLALQETLSTLDPEDPMDQQFEAGCRAALAEDYDSALGVFLDLVRRDRTYRKDGARKAMLTLFKVLGDDHLLTTTYRKQLMQALY